MGDVLTWRRRPVRAVIVREQLGETHSGLRYRFLIAPCIVGARPVAGTIRGAPDYPSAMRLAQDIATRTGLPIVREFGNAGDPQPPVAA